ncbi:hypothetical protein ACXN5S_06325 [Pseudoroseicyclus sp. H15]
MLASRYAILALPLAAAACSSGVVSGPVYDVDVPTNSASTYGNETANVFNAFDARNDAQTVATNLPASGTATYEGRFASVIDSGVDYSTLFGDVDLGVNFGNDTVSGTFNNLGARNSSLQYFNVDGQLYVAGNLNGAGIDADVVGVLESGVDVYEVDADLAAKLTEQGGSMLGVIDGTFYDNDDNPIPLDGVMYADN